MMNPLIPPEFDLYGAEIRDENKEMFFESKKHQELFHINEMNENTVKMISDSENVCENNKSEINIPDIDDDEIHGIVSQVEEPSSFIMKNSVEDKTNKNSTCCHNKVLKDGPNSKDSFQKSGCIRKFCSWLQDKLRMFCICGSGSASEE